MTHKAIFRQHWGEAFRDAAFRARLRDPNMAERWAQARFAKELTDKVAALLGSEA